MDNQELEKQVRALFAQRVEAGTATFRETLKDQPVTDSEFDRLAWLHYQFGSFVAVDGWLIDHLVALVQQQTAPLEQQLATARQLLAEELPYEERTSGYHAEEWTARVRAFLAGEEPNDDTQ